MAVAMGGRRRALRAGRRRGQTLHQSRKRGWAGGRAGLDPGRRDAADALPCGSQKRRAVVGESFVAHQEINLCIESFGANDFGSRTSSTSGFDSGSSTFDSGSSSSGSFGGGSSSGGGASGSW